MYRKRVLAHIKACIKSPVSYFIALKANSKNTNIERWSQASSLMHDWDERTALMGMMVPAGSSVIEFGAGRLVLPKYLKGGCSYQPVDLVARSDETIAFDLNASSYPELPQHYDFAVFSGVLEYVNDIPRLFRWLTEVADNVVFSYAVTDYLADPVTRCGNGWINSLSNIELLDILRKSGMQVQSSERWREQIIYLCSLRN